MASAKITKQLFEILGCTGAGNLSRFAATIYEQFIARFAPQNKIAVGHNVLIRCLPQNNDFYMFSSSQIRELNRNLLNAVSQKDLSQKNNSAFEILPFSDGFYPEIVKLWNKAFPTQLRTAEEWRFKDAQLSERLNRRRFVATHDGRVVGYGNIQNDELMTDAEVYLVRIAVSSEFRGRGLGSALYKKLESELQTLKACGLRAWIREDNNLGIRFTEKLGLTEFHRVWASALALENVDLPMIAAYKKNLLDENIQIKTFTDLQFDAERNQKLYELERELLLEMKAPDRVTPPPFELFLETLEKDPQVLHDGYFVAVSGDEYVGLSAFVANRANNELTTRLTGVRRVFRRRGIALSLKLSGIEYAKKHGFSKIRTANDSLNEPILAINNQLGFEREPAWILFSKNLRNSL